jgi:hypothetical protein
VTAILGLERQKELLGCSDGSSCTTELLQALGADFLLTGTLARLGGLLQVNLKVLDARSGATRTAWSDSTRDEAELPRLLTRAAEQLAETLTPRAPPTQLSAGFWVPLLAGAALLAGSGVCLGIEEAASASLAADPKTGVLSDTDARATVERGKAMQVAVPVLAGVGAAAVITAVIVGVAQKPSPVSVAVSPHGATLVVGGSF